MSAAAAAIGRLRTLPGRIGVRRLPALPARVRRLLAIAVAACLLLAAGYQFWLRDSFLVSVERVTITGLTTSDAERVTMALDAAGHSMTTLHVDQETLDRAVASYPVVRDLEVTTDFPHGLRIHVVEHVAAAIAVGDAGRIPVAADGTLLHGLPVEGRLPIVEVRGAFGVERLRDHGALAAAAVAGAAPAALRHRIATVEEDADEGLVADLRDGPQLIFGDTTRLRAKWDAAARVLADLEASGASYIDLRIPGRPAAGGLPAETITPVAPAGITVTPPATDPTAVAADPAAAPPTDGTTPPATDTTTQPTDPTQVPAATTPPATGVPPAEPATPAEPAPTTTVTGGTGGGAATAPAG